MIKLVALDKENSYLVTPSASYWKQRALWWGAYVMRFSIWCTSPFYTDIFCSEATVARRRKALGLLGSKSATHNALNLVKRQLVLDQLAKDPSGQTGPRLICEDIVFYTGIFLPGQPQCPDHILVLIGVSLLLKTILSHKKCGPKRGLQFANRQQVRRPTLSRSP